MDTNRTGWTQVAFAITGIASVVISLAVLLFGDNLIERSVGSTPSVDLAKPPVVTTSNPPDHTSRPRQDTLTHPSIPTTGAAVSAADNGASREPSSSSGGGLHKGIVFLISLLILSIFCVIIGWFVFLATDAIGVILDGVATRRDRVDCAWFIFCVVYFWTLGVVILLNTSLSWWVDGLMVVAALMSSGWGIWKAEFADY